MCKHCTFCWRTAAVFIILFYILQGFFPSHWKCNNKAISFQMNEAWLHIWGQDMMERCEIYCHCHSAESREYVTLMPKRCVCLQECVCVIVIIVCQSSPHIRMSLKPDWPETFGGKGDLPVDKLLIATISPHNALLGWLCCLYVTRDSNEVVCFCEIIAPQKPRRMAVLVWIFTHEVPATRQLGLYWPSEMSSLIMWDKKKG